MTENTATATTAEKSLALSDYQMIGALALAVEKMHAEQKSVAEATLRLMAACAEDLAKAAREVETIVRLGDLTGTAHRHPEIWAHAAAGETAKVNELLRPLAIEAYAN